MSIVQNVPRVVVFALLSVATGVACGSSSDAAGGDTAIGDAATDGGGDASVGGDDVALDVSEDARGDAGADPDAADASPGDVAPGDVAPGDVAPGDAGADAAVDATSDAADVAADVADAALDADDAGLIDAEIDVDPTCEASPTLTLAASELELWSFGEAASARIDGVLDGDTCGDVRALTTASWLEVEWDSEGLLVDVAVEDWPAGRGRETVVLAHAGTPALLATVEVRWHAMPRPAGGARPHVLVIGVDGMRPDAMLYANTPAFDVLRDHGAWTLDGRTHDTTTTDSSAGWATLFTGVDSDKHGVLNNGGIAAWDRSWPTFAWRAHEAGMSTAMVAQWVPALAQLHEDDAFTWTSIGGGGFVSGQIADRLSTHDDQLLLTHFDDVDHAGHASGFTPANPAYVEAIEDTDDHVREMLEAVLDRPDLVDENWLFVVMTDHGGEGRNHGPMNLPNQRIPFIFAGSGRPWGELLGPAVTQMDVAATVLDHLGLGPDDSWALDGRPRGTDPERLDPDAAPPTTETVCGDRIDDDGDALLDCDDPDCAASDECAPVCADASIGSAVGLAVATGDNSEDDTDYTITCARLPGARDASLAWTAPSAGAWRIDTVGSEVDTILAAWPGECVTPRDPSACNDDADGFASAITIDAEEGEVWTFVVTGFDGRTGAWVLNIATASDEKAAPAHDHEGPCRHDAP